MDNFRGKMYSVHSSNVSKIGWEFDEQIKEGVMRIEFKKGNVYDYFPVRKELFSEIFTSSSPGSFIQRMVIQNKLINFEKIS